MPASEAYEHSEMLLYRALILEEGGQVQEALSYLDECKVLPPKPDLLQITHLILWVLGIMQQLSQSCDMHAFGMH